MNLSMFIHNSFTIAAFLAKEHGFRDATIRDIRHEKQTAMKISRGIPCDKSDD